jgi:hypothetical protein
MWYVCVIYGVCVCGIWCVCVVWVLAAIHGTRGPQLSGFRL